MKVGEKNNDRGPQVSRRGFVLGASTIAAAARFGAVPAFAGAEAGESDETIRRLSIGFLTNADGMDLSNPSWEEGELLNVVPARSSDGKRITGPMRVKLHGFYPSDAAATLEGRSVALDVILKEGSDDEVPIYLWTHRSDPVRSTAAAGTLTLPRRAFKVALQVGDGSSDDFVAERRFGGDGLGLRKGIYFLGLAPRAWNHSTSVRHGHVGKRRASLMMTLDEAS